MPSVVQAPDERWATDLCRIWGGHDGWLTLALVMDCHTQQVLDWQPSLNGKATTAAAAEKLRQQDSHAGAVMVFIRTNPFKANIPQDSNSLQASLPMAISYTRFLARTAITLLERLHRPGYAYQNAGGMLMNLAPAAQRQGSLLEVASDGEKQTNLNRTLDRINQRYGRGSIALAGAGLTKGWKMRRGNLSPACTTDWKALPLVK